jgi:hypothetical protein
MEAVVRDEPLATVKPVSISSEQAPPSTGPGEFTRIISGASGAGALAGTPTVREPSAPAAPSLPMAEVPAQVAKPKPPEVKTSDPPAAPSPKKSTLESLVPILLVVNTFLLLLILLVTVFGLKNR